MVSDLSSSKLFSSDVSFLLLCTFFSFEGLLLSALICQ
uniref:Uncharacterized protein n=1 Tax=Arundo donax TaxID=35708 RepID=A0A0A9QLH8_ARUDO